MMRWAAAVMSSLALAGSACADADDDHWADMQKRGARAAAVAIVAAAQCPSVYLRKDKLDKFLELTNLTEATPSVRAGVVEVEGQFIRMSADQRAAECLKDFDELGPYKANILGNVR